MEEPRPALRGGPGNLTPQVTPRQEESPSDDEFGTPVAAPEGVPAPEPALMLAPGGLGLETSGYLLEAGEAVTVTVQVAPDGTGSTAGAALELTLSAGLEVVAGELNWSLPEVQGGEAAFVQEVVVRAANPQPDGVYSVSARLAQTDFLPKTTQLLLGGTSEQEIVVLTAPGAARRGLRVEVTAEWPAGGEQRPEGSTEPSVNSVDPSAVSGLSSLYLPVIGGAGKSAAKDADGFVRRWRIEASQGREAVSVLDEAATILISTRAMEAAGVEVEKLQLWSREDENDEWRPVPGRYLPEQQLYVAQTRHFSQWGMGEKLVVRGEVLPSVKGFGADGFTGYAQVSYPIEAPDGLGGMNPGLSLSYSSGSVDDLSSFVGDYFYGMQAGWVGYGWHLGGMSAITWDPANRKYLLNLGGSSAEIRWNGSAWVTDPNQFWRIERIQQSANHIREDIQGWRITTKDGTRYEFGSSSFHPDNGEPTDSYTEMIISNDGPHSKRRPIRWNLRLVVDAQGNRMEYEYKKVDPDTESALKVTGPYGSGMAGEARTQVRGDCIIGVYFTPWELGYDAGSYLSEVRWSGNSSAGISPRLRILLEREPRPDWRIDVWSNDDCAQARFLLERLKRVRVQVQESNGVWQSLAEYEMEYAITGGQNAPPAGMNAHHSLLTKIIHRGKGGNGTLSETTFAYEGIHSMARLKQADNGQGGSVTYSYSPEAIGDCASCGDIYWATQPPGRRPVTQVEANDGNGGKAITWYAYSGAKGQVVSNSFEYLGHAWNGQTTATVLDSPSLNRNERKVERWYYQRVGSEIDPRRGRMYQEEVRDGTTNALMQRSATQWVYLWQNGSYWVYAGSSYNFTYDNDGNDNPRGSWTHYGYEGSYGNRIWVEERTGDNNTILRKTQTDYFPANSGATYIVERPARVTIYDGGGGCVSEERFVYDGAGDYIAPPSRGLVTQHQVATDMCKPGVNYISPTAWDWLVSRYAHDGAGNVTREWLDDIGLNRDIRTVYDPYYLLFPVRRYNEANPSLDETGRYYGVNGAGGVGNGASLSDANAYWGRMQEFCGIDNICTQQAYDGFGRPTARWERSQGYPNVSGAQSRWFYWRKGEYGGNANIVLEWSLPRCYGNFSRQLYNGFGQLIQSQGPDENWTTNMDGCNPGTAGGEVVVDYAYDGLGRQIRQSVPRSVTSWNWTTSAPWAENWGNGYGETAFDAVGRPQVITGTNQVRTTYTYVNNIAAVDVIGVSGDGNRRQSWSEVDDLGRTTRIRSYYWSGANRIAEGEIALSYKWGTKLLTQAQFNDLTNSANNRLLTTMNYDLAGRKLTMSDADLGSWSYAYDKLSQLTRQSDARGKSTCLGYNALGQVTAKTIYNSSVCSGGVAVAYSYSYDGLGRFTSVNRTQPTTEPWSKSQGYDGLGRPSSETVTIDGISKTTTTYYDAWQRPYATRYPDSEVVKVNFNSLGLPKLMCTGALQTNGEYWCDSTPRYVDSANYDYAGRLYQMKFPAGGNLWRTQSYHAWTTAKNGGLLNEIKVGTSNGGSDRFYRQYTYNSFGDVATLKEGSTTYSFGYDNLGRLTSGYDKSYSYWPSNRFNSFEGNGYNYSTSLDSDTYHGVKWVNIPAAGNTNQTVAIRARGVQSSNVWPTMQLWVNGSLKASWQVNNTAWQTYSTTASFTGRDQIDVVFTNDSGTRDLFVEEIKVGAVTLLANTAIYDRGVGNDAFNGDDVVVGQQGLYWNGALRFVYGSNGSGFGYDLNGNMTYKLKQGEATVYTWNGENRLASVARNSSLLESYAYDVDGNRIKKVSGAVTTRTFFPAVYEEEVSGSTTTAIKHYSFNGQIIAVRKGGVLSYVHSDHLGSSSVETSTGGSQTASRTYYVYGSTRASSGTLQTDRTFTGQKQDGTGLIYYNARYYDSSLGTFLSPDTLVPDARRVVDYNRFLYVRGNPLSLNDPTGHCATTTNGEPDMNG
ncbi:MAG: hypothetical protein KJZ86_25920, partial [Caldilineaceae bacterium]|nr:hypothetical protein [Caldilineaceae bacterium]